MFLENEAAAYEWMREQAVAIRYEAPRIILIMPDGFEAKWHFFPDDFEQEVAAASEQLLNQRSTVHQD